MNGGEPFAVHPFPAGEEEHAEALSAGADHEKRAAEKKRLRALIRKNRRALQEAFFRRESEAFLPFLSALPEWKRARTVMAYAALQGEPDLSPVLREILCSGRRLVLPRCEGESIIPRLVTGLSRLSPGAYGIPEPGEGCPAVRPEEIDLLLVPGLAFDREGFRLGQGGGYYDRFLPQARGFRLGVCHAFELLPAVPREAHDARMDGAMTGDGIERIRI